MTDKPILFSPPMVAALIEGRKTQTRPLLKPQPEQLAEVTPLHGLAWKGNLLDENCALFAPPGSTTTLVRNCVKVKLPYAVGDRLWIQEDWNLFWFSQDGDEAWPSTEILTQSEIKDIAKAGSRVSPPQIVYRESTRARKWFSDQPWRPANELPRWASRMTLLVTDVRVQRVQEISRDDCVAEGCKGWYSAAHPDQGETDGQLPEEEFRDLWDSLHADPGTTWEDNPWIVAYTFEVEK